MDRDVLVVGAGLSGLVAAREIQNAGFGVTVLDKGRSSGGRLATRRIGEGLADHGAQFFTVRTETYQQQVDQWLAKDRVYIWGYGWSDGSLKRTPGDGHPRYVVRGGMNNLAKYLEENLDEVRVNVQITSVHKTNEGWRLLDTQEGVYTCRGLVMTPPVPQTLQLLGDVPLSDADQQNLDRIEYGPCLCGMHVIEGDIELPDPGALQNFDEDVYWIADNERKGISGKRVITTHAGARVSRQRYDEPDAENLAWLRAALEPHLKNGARIVDEQLKKWRYSVPLTTYPHDTLAAEGLRLVFAGDAFGGRGRIEGAYLSGLAAGQAMVEKMNS